VRWPRENSEPSRQALRRRHAHDCVEHVGTVGVKAVGLARSTYRRLPMAQTPADPDAEMRAWLRAYATKHPCHGFRRAWAALRYDERREVNKKVHRLWREEGLQVRVHRRGLLSRAGSRMGEMEWPTTLCRHADDGVADGCR
jgi:HTH-like domain